MLSDLYLNAYMITSIITGAISTLMFASVGNVLRSKHEMLLAAVTLFCFMGRRKMRRRVYRLAVLLTFMIFIVKGGLVG